MKTTTVAILLSVAMAASAQNFQFQEVTCNNQSTQFALFAPQELKTVKVRIYANGEGGRPLNTVKMHYTTDGIWRATVKADLRGKFYTFDIGRGECPGVFAKAVGVNGKRACILDLADTNPAGWDNDQRPVTKNPTDLVIYEMHHRDFSIARPEAKFPGKFLALTEPWAIQHLTKLGINAVHILPSYDYGSVDETRLNVPQYNWGYDPVNYNVPDGSYSTDPYKPAVRINEFKQMVQALHKAGIRVILDVVFNHTYDLEGSNFQRTYPDYYYRKTADGNYSNGSGCGNETASEKPMMRQFIIESVKYWVNEYHIDGFRFDLMGVHDLATMQAVRTALDEIDPTLFIYGEGWSAGACALENDQLATKANISRLPRIAAFSDELRDALRGPFSDDSKGAFLAGKAGEEESIKFGIAGGVAHPQVDIQRVNYSKAHWATEPSQLIAYVSCHDDMCLVDRLKASIPNISEEELIRLDLLAQTVVFTSQGVPFMLAGEEMLRNKQGVHNSFQSPDSVNQLAWGNLKKYPQVFDYYSHLIALRRNHPAFRLGDANLIRKHLEFLPVRDSNVVAFRLKDYAGRDDWRNIIVIINANKTERYINVPQSTYTIVCQNGKIDEAGLGILCCNQVAIAPQSALIIHD